MPRTLLLCLLFGCSPLAAQRFTLSGTVVDGTGDRPLAGVAVTLQAHLWDPPGDPVVTDAQGRFAFGGLAAGDYVLTAEGSGFGRVLYGDGYGALRVGGPKGDKSVVFRIVPRASLEGVIRDEFGEPMVGAGISLIRSVWREGRTMQASVGQKYSDDRGRYHFGNLFPASYSVCVSGAQNAAAPVPGPVDFSARIANRAYVRTCTRTFPLAPGQRTQVDLSPTIGSTATVSGNLRNAPPGTGVSVFLAPEEEGTQNFGASIAGAGAFTIRNVPPGRYRLRASGVTSQGNLTADLLLDVGGADVNGIELALQSGASVEVAIHGIAENQLDPTKVNVILRNLDSPNNSRVVERDPEGGLKKVEALAAGRYRLAVTSPPDTCVDSVKLGDREIRGAPFEVAPGAALRLDATLTRNCGTVVLRAVREGAAVPAARVVLLQSGTPRDPGEVREDFADDEGEYSFSALPPGHYLLWAWAIEGAGAIPNPTNLAAIESQAVAVDVKAGESTPVDVPLIAKEGQ